MLKEVNPREAWAFLKEDPSAVLVDVRTPEEWNLVGVPDLSSLQKEFLAISWQNLQGEKNQNFIQLLQKAVPNQGNKIFFLCKSGKRSLAAVHAVQHSGFTEAYNIRGGFEGEKDEKGQRGRVEGWKAELLPWFQP